MHNLIRLMESFYNTPWAILDTYLLAMESQLMRAFRAGSTETLPAVAPENRALKSSNTASGIGIIPIQGGIGNRASFYSDYFGWPTTERLGQAFQQMVDDPTVGAIIFDINSPGGLAQGNQELHDLIMKNKGTKPVVAVVNGMAASAAYFIASAADEIVLTPSSEVGSIGCVMTHADFSKALENEGIDVTVITAGKYKWEGHPYEPLSDEARAEFQRVADHHYDLFTKAVAKGRNVSVSTVKSDFGQGRMVQSKDALAKGMVDRIGTMDDALTRLGAKRQSGNGKMEDESTDVTNRERELEVLRLKNRLLGL